MHARLSRDGSANPTYDGTTPDDAQHSLTTQWARTSSALHRRGLRPYGFRVVEPQHDGTPHWHLLLFMPAAEVETTTAILHRYALAEDPDEPGAALHRFKVVRIDPSKGSAAGYVAKYVAKNIDGFGLDSNEWGLPANETAERVDAWASTWRIRQFQQIGGPAVTIWREARRLTTKDLPGLLARAVAAADTADWQTFVTLLGGPTAPREDAPIWPHRAWSDAPGRYGEPVGDVLIGLACNSVVVSTRIHVWRIQRPSGIVPSLEYCQ